MLLWEDDEAMKFRQSLHVGKLSTPSFGNTQIT